MPSWLTGSAAIGNVAKIAVISVAVVYLVKWGMQKANINSILLG